MAILLPRIPLPTMIMSSLATASSTRIGQLGGRPMGVMPPYSMPVSRTASSIPAKEIFRTSSRFLITRLTSARSVASTRHGHVGAPAGDHDTVGRDLQRHFVRSTERSRVRSARVDGSHEAFQSEIGNCIPDGQSQQFGMIECGLPVQSSDDVHERKIILRFAVTDAADPRLVDYVRLRDASLRRHLEAEHGFFIAEGAKVIHGAVDAGYRPRSFLFLSLAVVVAAVT